ncbi:tetratricopeptide repeat protein, partial [Desulfovibrio sulfodismutans]
APTAPPLAAPPQTPSGDTSGRTSGLPPLPPGLESREGELKARVTPPSPPIAAAPVAPVFSGPQAVRSKVSRDAPPPGTPGEPLPPPTVPAAAPEPAAPSPSAPVPEQAAPAAPVGSPASGEPGQPATEPATEPTEEEPPLEQAQAESENDGMLMAAQAKRLVGENEEALAMLTVLKERNTLTPEQREETLYARAETLYDINKKDPLAHFDAIQGAFQEALNYNAKSSHIPGALLVLGMLNLKAGNIPEATAYFSILRKRYPNDENIPLIHFYWGEHYFEKGDYQKAAKEYQELIQRYPESRYVREASMGMAKSLVRLGQYKEAWQIADYIEKRWPRYYTEFPPLLRINGEITYRLGDFKKSKDYYLTSYNIDPNSEGSDLVLARLGDIASHLGKAREATEFYELDVSRFPDKEGGLISKMRLAERGVYDDPSISDMFSAFDKPVQGGPEAIYSQIVRDHPQSPLAPLAQLKLAMWQLYKDRHLQALESATTFEKMFPNNPLSQRAGEVAATAFDRMVEPMLRNQQYVQIAELWREHPLLEKHRSIISDKGQLAAALSFLRTGNPGESLRLALPFVQPTQTEPGVNALLLALHIYQEGSAWREILSLLDKVRDWKFTMDQRQRLEYSAAQALEHLGDTARSRPLWARLAADFSLPAPRRAIAMYYQAKEAKAKNDPEKTLVFAQEAMALLRENNLDQDKIVDCLNMLVDAAKSLGQYPQALDYAEQYGKTLPENGPDFAANRFRMAAIYREMGETDKWRSTLEQMRDAMPNTLYGRMAASELSARALEDRADALTRSN